jgi:transcriptional regulator with XRE-family HTH domain
MPCSFIDSIRQAVEASAMSRYRIAKLTGINQSQLSRFARGVAGLSMDGIDRLADVLGLEVKVNKAKASRAAKERG